MKLSEKQKEVADKAVTLASDLGRTYEPFYALDGALRSLLRKEKRKRVWSAESAELSAHLKEARRDATGTTALLIIDALNPRILKKVCFSDVSKDYDLLETYRHKLSDGMAARGFMPMYQILIKYTDENKAKALLMVDKLISGMAVEESRRVSPESRGV
ncbi:MAG: hypothetical protein ABSD68_00470 [Candidatus Micrarchaeales archaeon]|jgi:hypothetical protein